MDTGGERTIHLLRHASHGDVGRRLTGRGDDCGLTGAGLIEAQALGARLAALAGAGLTVFTSPRRRAFETAREIAAAVGARFELHAGLDELDFGAWTGRTFVELSRDERWWRWNMRRASGRTPSGDDMAQAGRRLDRAISAALARPARDAALVSHLDAIRAWLLPRMGQSIDAYETLDIPCGGVAQLVFRGDALARVVLQPAWGRAP